MTTLTPKQLQRVWRPLYLLKNVPHTHTELTANERKHKYGIETAAYPSATINSYKYWPPVARVDNVYGDKNLFCSCPTMDEYKESA